MAEAFNSLFKAEPVRNRGPWKGIDDLEIAVAEYIDWYNHRRLHGEIGLVPPVEYETTHRTTRALAHDLAQHTVAEPTTSPADGSERDFHASIKTRYLTADRR